VPGTAVHSGRTKVAMSHLPLVAIGNDLLLSIGFSRVKDARKTCACAGDQRLTFKPVRPHRAKRGLPFCSAICFESSGHVSEDCSRTSFTSNSSRISQAIMTLHTTIRAAFAILLPEISPVAISMCSAGTALFVIGILAAKRDLVQARRLNKIVVLSNMCFAIPLAVFGAEHLAAAKSLAEGVPAYVPGHLFWAYFVGFALIAAALSIATKIQLQWSGLLFGIMMFLFDAMIHIPRTLADPHNRISWIIVLREMSFGSGAWILSGSAVEGWGARGKSVLITVGRLLIGSAAIFFSVQHFLHPALAPGVPLGKPMAVWIPARVAIGYLTGVILLFSGICILLAMMTRSAAIALGTWIVLLVVYVYGPMLVAALLAPSTAVKVEGINYFADTLLFAGVILTLARATPGRAEIPH
jgi:hypothetical protein